MADSVKKVIAQRQGDCQLGGEDDSRSKVHVLKKITIHNQVVRSCYEPLFFT